MLSSSCEAEVYGSHTTISEGRTNLSDVYAPQPCSEQKMAQFRTHYLKKELSYVSTQQSGQLDTFILNHFSVY